MTDPWPILETGDDGRNPFNVKAVQYLLRCAPRGDWKNLEPDGAYGPKTKQAVQEFQRWVRIDDDGKVGEQTWKKLTDGQAIKCIVRQGDTGDCVRAAQSELVKNEELKSKSQIDGDFGPVTDGAVRHFQDRMQLPVDGIVGPRTWESLIRNNNPG